MEHDVKLTDTSKSYAVSDFMGTTEHHDVMGPQDTESYTPPKVEHDPGHPFDICPDGRC